MVVAMVLVQGGMEEKEVVKDNSKAYGLSTCVSFSERELV